MINFQRARYSSCTAAMSNTSFGNIENKSLALWKTWSLLQSLKEREALYKHQHVVPQAKPVFLM